MWVSGPCIVMFPQPFALERQLLKAWHRNVESPLYRRKVLRQGLIPGWPAPRVLWGYAIPAPAVSPPILVALYSVLTIMYCMHVFGLVWGVWMWMWISGPRIVMFPQPGALERPLLKAWQRNVESPLWGRRVLCQGSIPGWPAPRVGAVRHPCGAMISQHLWLVPQSVL